VSYCRTQDLGKIGREARIAIPPLIELLKDKDEDVQRAAVEALGKIGPEAQIAILALTELLNDEEEDVRTAAAEALEKIKGGKK